MPAFQLFLAFSLCLPCGSQPGEGVLASHAVVGGFDRACPVLLDAQWSRGCQYYGYLVPVAEYVLAGIGALCAHRWAAELLLVDVIMTCQG